jgi:hypothetical protein
VATCIEVILARVLGLSLHMIDALALPVDVSFEGAAGWGISRNATRVGSSETCRRGSGRAPCRLLGLCGQKDRNRVANQRGSSNGHPTGPMRSLTGLINPPTGLMRRASSPNAAAEATIESSRRDAVTPP